jgi:hypothetical protein
VAVRSRFLGYAIDPGIGVTVVLFTVPAERTAIVRRWSCVHRGATATKGVLSVRTGGISVNVWRGIVGAETTVAEMDTNLVLGPGDELRWLTLPGETSSALHVAATGSLLVGAPT